MFSGTRQVLFRFGKEEGSRRRQSWTEGREGDRQARFGVFQAVAGETQETPRRSASQVQEIRLKTLEQNSERSLYYVWWSARAMRIDVGARLRAERKARNLSQADLERRTGLARCRISWLENGRAIPTLETLEKLSNALEISLCGLLCESGEQEQSGDSAAKMTVRSRRKKRSKEVRLLGEFREHFVRMSEEDQDLLLVIARKIASREYGRVRLESEGRTT